MEFAERTRVRVRSLMGIIENQNTRLLLDFPKRDSWVDDSESQATEGRTIVGGMNLAKIL
jgi:hypothetical protein